MLVQLCSKSFKLDFSSTCIENFQMYKLVLEKAEESEIRWILEKAREFQKITYFCFIDYVKAFDYGSQQTEKFLKRWEF